MASVIQKTKSTRFSPPTSYDIEAYERRKKLEFQAKLQSEIEQKKATQLRNALEKSGLLETIKTKTFDNYIIQEPWQERMKGICEEYSNNPEKWLFVSGPSGCGKTHLCTAVVGKLAERKIPVWYMLYREEIEKLKPNSWTDPEERKRLMNLYKNAGSLYIDDLFKGRTTDSDIKTVFELLDYRYRENKRTIISTELSLKAISDIDTAIAGRISEKSKKALVKNDKSRNYRMKGNR